MNRAGRTFTSGFLVITGAGFLVISGTGVAHAESAAIPKACSELAPAFKAFAANVNAENKQLTADKADPAKVAADVTKYQTTIHNFGDQLTKIALQGTPAMQSATRTYVTDLEAETAAEKLDAARLKADTDRLTIAACEPKGAPRTGGGSAAGRPDPALAAAGGAAALAGIVVAGLSLRARRASAEHG